MTTWVLDSTVLIDHVRGRFGATDLLYELFSRPDAICICDVVVVEVLSGGGEDERDALERVIDSFEYVSTPPAAAKRGGDLRRTSGRASGRHLGDAVIAGLALEMGATVVTRNPRDFQRLGVPVRAYGQTPA